MIAAIAWVGRCSAVLQGLEAGLQIDGENFCAGVEVAHEEYVPTGGGGNPTSVAIRRIKSGVRNHLPANRPL